MQTWQNLGGCGGGVAEVTKNLHNKKVRFLAFLHKD